MGETTSFVEFGPIPTSLLIYDARTVAFVTDFLSLVSVRDVNIVL